MQDCSLYLVKTNSMQKVCKKSPQSSKILGLKFQRIYHLGKFALVRILEGTLPLSIYVVSPASLPRLDLGGTGKYVHIVFVVSSDTEFHFCHSH